MANSTQVNLEMISGDTFSFDLILHDIDPESIESLYFTVKRRATDSDSAAVLQKSLANGGIIRIGANNDRHLRQQNYLCINYNTKQIIANS